MATGGEEMTQCPLCQAVVGSGDALQLHYLTQCAKYDQVSSEQPRSKLTSQSQHGNSEGSGDNSTRGTRVSATSRDTYSVQFMWQPLSEISYPTVTLLASFDNGSVDLHLDPEGGHYASDQVQISSGSYEGQLVVGDSFVHPVKKFNIERNGDIVVLQFEVAREGQEGTGYGSSGYNTGYGTSQYGSGYVQQNPSYSGSSYSNPMFDQSSQYYGGTRQRAGSSSGHPHGSEGQHHTIDKNRGDISGGPSKWSTPLTPAAPVTQSTQQRSTPASQGGGEKPLGTTATTRAATSPLVTGSTSSPSSNGSQLVTNSLNQTPASEVIQPINIPIDTGTKPGSNWGASGGGNTGFNVGQLQQSGTTRDPQSNLREVRQRLSEVTKERDSLKQNNERVNAQWEGRVKRLQQQLKAQQQQGGGGEAPSEDVGHLAALEEAQATIESLESELSNLRRQVNSGSQATRQKQEAEKELVELKDRNTALEQQMIEYVDTIKDQSKYIQSLSTTTKANDVDVLRYQQEAIHLTEFVKKQQLEQEEALSSLRKKIDWATQVADENHKIHQLNVGLTGELEDYRTQTKRLLAELRQKDEEVVMMRQALEERGASGSNSHDLELASMKEKCDAWQEEVERLAPFRDEVEQLQEEIASLRNDNAELSRGMQSVVDESEKKQSEMTHKIADYDRLMSRFVELQQTRVTLEKELQPLREERAAMLMENATLREGSQPQTYTKLKQEFQSLNKFCQQLQSQLEEQSTLISAHQDTNVEMQQKLDKATDPERLQSIRERMERYKQERDASRKQIEELQAELVVEQEKATEQLSEVAGKTEQHIQTTNQQMQQLECDVTHFSAKANDYEGRMRRYREERNKLTASNKQLREQLTTLQATVSTLLAQSSASGTEDPSYLESMPSMTTNYSPELEASYSPTRERQPSSPLAEYQPQQYTTDEDQYPKYSGHIESPVDKVERSLSGLTVEGKPLRSKRSSESYNTRERSSSSSKKDKQQHYFDIADVKTKEGIVSMYIQKPQTVLNAKYKPRVVVKRGEELFESGTLMFVGNVGGKDLAGIQLDLRQPKPTASPGGATSLTTYSDGTYKDGKRYFKCSVGYGLYVTLSRVYIEMESATV